MGESTRPLREVQKDLGHAVAGLKVGGKVTTVQFYGDTLSLGHQATLGEMAYLRIETPLIKNTTRYYWRVRSYNIFVNDQWYADDVSSTSALPDQPFIALANPEGVRTNLRSLL